jgi:hypothetical protein
MKLRQQARVLKRKALTSFITAAEAFNSPRDDGRVTKVLLHLQHAFEMLLKAALVQAGGSGCSTPRPPRCAALPPTQPPPGRRRCAAPAATAVTSRSPAS